MKTKDVLLSIAIVALAIAASGAQECTVATTPFYGIPWKPSYALYSSESGWKRLGRLEKVGLFYNRQTGCMMGIQLQYEYYFAYSGATKLIGEDKHISGAPWYNAELQLEAGEGINEISMLFDSCLTFISLSTSLGKALAVGNRAGFGTMNTSTPADVSDMLVYIKAYTDPFGTGGVQSVQIAWSSEGCLDSTASKSEARRVDEAAAAAAAAVAAAAEAVEPLLNLSGNAVSKHDANVKPIKATTAKGSKATTIAAADHKVDAVFLEKLKPESAAGFFGNDSAAAAAAVAAAKLQVPAADILAAAEAATASVTAAIALPPASQATPTSSVTNASECTPGKACRNGTCPTTSCALNGMGKDVIALMCYGTNIMPNPLLDAAGGNPCTNLACKLDRPNCTSIGLLGLVGGFCTGRVVAMGQTAKLHTTGKAFLGYPCIENKGPVLDILPTFGDYTARGTYLGKAWKVCDCIAGLGLKQDIQLPSLPLLKTLNGTS